MTWVRQPRQRPRFGPIRKAPPDEVLRAVPGATAETGWTAIPFGNAGGYPNGGIWRVAPDLLSGRRPNPVALYVKRTGASYLGDDRVWRCRFCPDDPQWWGREASFYESDLAKSGWTAGVRAARCHTIDDHDGCRDLWLESIDAPASLAVCARAANGLAGWQVANVDTTHAWLSNDWIPTHIRRHGLDNERTLAHPAWPSAVARGLDPVLREMVEARVTDPSEVRRQLHEFPQVLTHYDFHHCNIGTVDDEVAIIDWAFVGWGPIGHDAGHLALDLDADRSHPSEAWHAMQTAYCNGLDAAGWCGDFAQVRRSMEVSNHLRLAWCIDHVLNTVDQMSDDTLAAASAKLCFLADLQ